MKTIAALLMMTGAVGAQSSSACRLDLPAGSVGSCFTGAITGVVVTPSEILVLRDKRGHTMLIRNIDACAGMASYLKASPDIESAECFK
jgi:hypothetical protein